jgi:hypothetical protein
MRCSQIVRENLQRLVATVCEGLLGYVDSLLTGRPDFFVFAVGGPLIVASRPGNVFGEPCAQRVALLRD